MKKLLLPLLILLLIPLVSAEQHHLKLLAVSEDDTFTRGKIADLYLEIKDDGKGRVFLETFPLTEFDTQISTRFAKEIACNFMDTDCDDYDFIYTIKADSSIIGGPSAGAAISCLTLAAIHDLPIREDIAITGTINSGGFVGRVGGIKQKIEAAAENDIRIVLIPKGESEVKNTKNETLQCIKEDAGVKCEIVKLEPNSTIDLIEYGAELGVEVIEVSTLDEAMLYFTGSTLRENDKEIIIDPDYTDVMKSLAVLLCNRTAEIAQSIDLSKINRSDPIYVKAVNLSSQSDTAFKEEKYYSSASFCFGSNVKYGEILLQQIEDEGLELKEEFSQLKESMDEFNTEVDNIEIKTISDLEAFMIVKERLVEATSLLDDAEEQYNNNETFIPTLALAIERIHSAQAWSRFFSLEGKQFELDEKFLEESCNTKILEAEERYQYISIFVPLDEDSKKELDLAYIDRKNKDFELCLFKASKAKAEVDSILNVVGMEEDDVSSLIDQKLVMIESEIARSTSEDVFPILGYSYFEYADSLKDSDRYSALLYLEYALELSDLDMYFKEKQPMFSAEINYRIIAIVIGSILIGLFVGLLFSRKTKEFIVRIK